MGAVIFLRVIDEETGTAFDGIDHRLAHLCCNSRATEASAQSACLADKIGGDIICRVHHNGAVEGMVVDALLFSTEVKRQPMFSRISIHGGKKAKTAFVGRRFIGKGRGKFIT